MEEIKQDLKFQPGNGEVVIVKLLEMINKNLALLIQETVRGRQDK